ncbi:MAG: peptide deformylase [Gammaproteobacteria bacterium RIFCSPHIGHO2_12_FULL_41_15]|nr:MAG: peptide deformylase [Gammaproteobacteria bacterium RIFCSPHIGHO2_12_FULL_41_15]
MAILEVLKYPDPRLRLKGEPVERVDNKIKKIVTDMFDTLYGSESCAGYSAIQLNIQKQIIVIDISARKNEPLCLINAKIVAAEGETQEPEGCMSLPDIFAPVKRAAWIKVEALDQNGEHLEIETEGFLSACIQHEIDHCNGILFIDHLSKLKRAKVENALRAMRQKGVK